MAVGIQNYVIVVDYLNFMQKGGVTTSRAGQKMVDFTFKGLPLSTQMTD